MGMSSEDIKELMSYSDVKLYVLIGMDLSGNILFSRDQIMRSVEMAEYERSGERNEYRHTKDISVTQSKESMIDRWYHVGKSWYSGTTERVKEEICRNEALRVIRLNEKLGYILEMANFIRSLLGASESYRIIIAAILLARKGLNLFCKDFDARGIRHGDRGNYNS